MKIIGLKSYVITSSSWDMLTAQSWCIARVINKPGLESWLMIEIAEKANVYQTVKR